MHRKAATSLSPVYDDFCNLQKPILAVFRAPCAKNGRQWELSGMFLAKIRKGESKTLRIRILVGKAFRENVDQPDPGRVRPKL